MRQSTEFVHRIKQRAQESDFSGVISIQQAQTNLYSQSFGYRMANEKLPNEITTRFGIAFGTKLITALGIGCLIDSGDLSLTAKVGQFGTDFLGLH